MPICFHCNEDQANVKMLFLHFKKVHWLFEQHARYECREGQCNRIFENKFTFSRHLHTHNLDSISKTVCSKNPIPIQENLSMQSLTSSVTTDENVTGDEQLPCKFVLKDVAARCLAKCKSGTGSLQQADSTLVEFIVDDI